MIPDTECGVRLLYMLLGIPYQYMCNLEALLLPLTFEKGEDYHPHLDPVCSSACDAGDGKFSGGLMLNQ